MEPGAQKEIRDYANAIYDLVKPHVPITMKAFIDFRMNVIQLSGPEIEAIANGTPIKSPGERREFEEKIKRLGLDKNIR
jgi:thymidylate synthase (FAD)